MAARQRAGERERAPSHSPSRRQIHVPKRIGSCISLARERLRDLGVQPRVTSYQSSHTGLYPLKKDERNGANDLGGESLIPPVLSDQYGGEFLTERKSERK